MLEGDRVERQRRIGFNEAVFREVNERVREVSESFAGTVDEQLPLVCECGDASCTERIEMSRDEYEALRADPARFAIVPGHDAPDVEEVVAHGAGYDIVRKFGGVPTEVAEATDPRSG